MLKYSQYRITEANDPSQPTNDLKSLETYLIRAISGYIESLKTKLTGQMRDSMRQNQGMTGKIKNWWGNWVNGTTGETTENLPIEVGTFADKELLQELNLILEGPIDQTIAQMINYLDILKKKLIKTVQDSIARVNQVPSPTTPSIPLPPHPLDPAKPVPAFADKKFAPQTTTAVGNHGSHTSRFQTDLPSFGQSFNTSNVNSQEPDTTEPPEREKNPEDDYITHGIKPKLSRKAKGMGQPKGSGSPSLEPSEEPTSVEPESIPEPSEPQAQKARRRAKFLGDRSPEEEREKLNQSPLSKEEAVRHEKVLKLFNPEARSVYEGEKDPFLQRQMIHFLQSIQDQTLDAITHGPSQGSNIGHILTWIKAYDPQKWAKLGVNLPATTNVLGSHNHFTDWADWVLKENIQAKTALLVERLRRQRLAH